MRIISAHAAQPQAVFLAAVENGQLVFLDEFLPFARRKTQGVAIALQRQKEFRAVLVLPFAGIDGAAPQPNDLREMLDSYRTGIFAASTRGALKGRFRRNVLPQQRLLRTRAKLIQVATQPQNNLFGI